MDKKKSLQFSLVILLILTSIVFYKKFFTENTNLVTKKLDEKKIEDSDSNKDINNKNSNLIETLKYVSQDLLTQYWCIY